MLSVLDLDNIFLSLECLAIWNDEQIPSSRQTYAVVMALLVPVILKYVPIPMPPITGEEKLTIDKDTSYLI